MLCPTGRQGRRRGTTWRWYGMVWYGVVWYGMVRYGMLWCGMVCCAMLWHAVVCCVVVCHAVRPAGKADDEVVQGASRRRRRALYIHVYVPTCMHTWRWHRGHRGGGGGCPGLIPRVVTEAHTCMYACMRVPPRMHACVYLHVCMHACTSTYACVHACMRACMYIPAHGEIRRDHHDH